MDNSSMYKFEALYLWYHRSLLGVRLTFGAGVFVLHHHRVDNDCYKTERSKEARYDGQTERPAKHVGVPVGHPRAVKTNHHAKDGHRCTDAHRCNVPHTDIPYTRCYFYRLHRVQNTAAQGCSPK